MGCRAYGRRSIPGISPGTGKRRAAWQQESGGGDAFLAAGSAANLCCNILDFRGFDSSRISNLGGGPGKV